MSNKSLRMDKMQVLQQSVKYWFTRKLVCKITVKIAFCICLRLELNNSLDYWSLTIQSQWLAPCNIKPKLWVFPVISKQLSPNDVTMTRVPMCCGHHMWAPGHCTGHVTLDRYMSHHILQTIKCRIYLTITITGKKPLVIKTILFGQWVPGGI